MARYKTILSASRMCDMPKYYPDDIIRECLARLDKGVAVHTLVLWTKHPAALLSGPLHGFLSGLIKDGSQIFIQLTITGMGAKVIGANKNGDWKIEPNSPPYEDALALLPELIEFTGGAGRIKVRIDPLVKVKDLAGRQYSNVKLIEPILVEAAGHAIDNFSFSFLEPGYHAKVDRRFKSIGCEIIRFSEFERAIIAENFRTLESRYKVKIYACCVEGFEGSACIDGKLLSGLHPAKDECDPRELRRRPKCGCVSSVDLGGWPVKKCPTGCDYCYANPVYI
ncbi:MAG TPA: hypothetical protein DC017_02115 [Candidatus Wallbacteria bacterium]|nr:hypothetical protein [Candidatus Wallbacteria bacterium]